MNVLVITDPCEPIPPPKYGGAERVIDVLCRGLHERGHKVRLIAPAGSTTTAELIIHPKQRTTDCFWYDWGRISGLATFARSLRVALKEIDVVHSFKAIQHWWPLQALVKQPLIFTFENPISPPHIEWLLRIRERKLRLCNISDAQKSGIARGCWYTVYNGVDTNIYSYSDTPAHPPYLLYVGRISPLKGTHIAIDVAERCGSKLIIAGNISTEEGGREYFNSKVQPRLTEQIEWIGEVSDSEKGKLYGGAMALLFPIEWSEPFGLVMVESMLCGTPVVAFDRGSVPEVIDNGKTGYVVNNIEEMVNAVSRIGQLSRSTCAEVARKRFSASVMVDQYLQVYNELMVEAEENSVLDTEFKSSLT